MENEAKSVLQLLNADKYIIPVYQRNYAWEQPEIEQLIDDISHALDNGIDYYIGNLIVFQKDGYFEIIDGQQRHTTLSLIHATLLIYFKDFFIEQDNIFLSIIKSNLTYKARKESKLFFETMFSDFNNLIKNQEDIFVYTITQIIKPKLDKVSNKGKWINYFYTNVRFFRIEVPADTDLYHYFEVMNSRGEQLEEHEVLKAKFMSAYIVQEDKSLPFMG